jgi:hypothetical protein
MRGIGQFTYIARHISSTPSRRAAMAPGCEYKLLMYQTECFTASSMILTYYYFNTVVV